MQLLNARLMCEQGAGGPEHRRLQQLAAELGEVVWPKRIYQHPERQGEYAEAKYETRHDIYCLGVCILEILLWRPFVVDAPTGAQGSQLKICDLFPQYAFRRKELTTGSSEARSCSSIQRL